MTAQDTMLDSSASSSGSVSGPSFLESHGFNSSFDASGFPDQEQVDTDWDAPNWAQGDSEVVDSSVESETAAASASFESRGFEYRRGNGIAFLSSILVHTTLLLVLACWVFAAGKNTRGLLLTAQVNDPQQTSVQETESFELSYEPAQEYVYENSRPEFEVEMELENPFEVVKDGTEPASALTSISKENIIRDLQPSGKKRGASFFGAYAEGNRFIYVLDSSRSMQGERWQYACQQLLDSLGGLKKGQQFYVICFDAETTFLFNKPPQRARYFEADNDTIERVRNWLRSRTLGSATMPATALQYALKFDPDAVFLLSDGELQDNSLFMLRMINNTTYSERRIPIHTVHLFSDLGRMTLKQIAKENGGTFTPVENNRRFGAFRRR